MRNDSEMGGERRIARQKPDGESPIPLELNARQTTPVYGTAQLSTDLAAPIRHAAYRIPSHEPLRWLMLLAADRVDSASNLARELVVPGQQPLVLRHFARQARAHPKGAAVLGAIVLGSIFFILNRRASAV